MEENATVLDRISHYVDTNRFVEAKVLSVLADHLEECYAWDVVFDIDS